MKISVIVPVYNVEEYLIECLESLTAQTIEDMEIIVVDDGSPDNCPKMCDEFAEIHKNVKVIHKENGGLSSARNAALKIAQGEYIGFVDSDDWVDANMYETMYDTAKKENADIVICDMVDHFPDRVIYHHSSEFENPFKVTPSACNKIFKYDLIKNDEFPIGLWYEDLEFTTKQLMKTDHVGVVHKGFYHCHCREVSTMFNDNSVKNLDIVTVINHLKTYVKENGWEDKYKNVIEYLMIEHILITSINRVAKHKNDKKKMVIRQMREFVKSEFPNYTKDEAFLKMNRNRRIIARLNGSGMESLSRLLLWAKEKVK